MSEELYFNEFKFGGWVVYVPFSKKDHAAYHVDKINENDTEESIKKRGTFMGYIRRYAAEHNAKKISAKQP